MKRLHFSIQINAPKEKVWHTLLDDKTYRRWTSVFSENSYADTDWQEGSKAVFTDGSGKGMVSRILRNIPNEFLSIQHLGVIDNGVEDYDSEETKKWAGALENYTLKEADNATELLIDLEGAEAWEDFFQSTWPKALQIVKELAESH